jgi:uncharacterized protein YecE (DUF72 family)
MTELRIGTSAFTAAGWEGSFYPKGMKPADYLTTTPQSSRQLKSIPRSTGRVAGELLFRP